MRRPTQASSLLVATLSDEAESGALSEVEQAVQRSSRPAKIQPRFFLEPGPCRCEIAAETGKDALVAIGHGTVGSNDLAKAKAFYDALLGSAGAVPLFEHPSGGRAYGVDGTILFVVLGPYDGGPATVGNGSMHGFCFDTRAEVDAFHAKAMALGGVDEGAPGERAPGYYMSYFRDLDGNKLCAFRIG